MNEDYPIFVKWLSILDWLMDRAESFPKSVRFTVSSRLVNLSLEIMDGIIELIYSRNKAKMINQANLKLEKLRVLIRICFKRRYLSAKQYEYIAEEINESGRMLGGWKKYETG
ncbi:MAG: diversity-generating retroelement protein Avd [Deltaproteobacteria bacterium]|jgi:hypothetical protein|nr:diversity-generating retroelement protein Avd [Deltaproteobacteria bacterium]